MRLVGRDGHGIELRIDGYQFPDAEDERLRTSWLMIAGTAYGPEGSWSFRWQALTPPDAVHLAAWLRTAEAGDTLRFTEPNLSLALTARGPDETVLRIGLDLEFSPPWRKHIRAGDPYTIPARLSTADLLAAADDWAAESARFPG
ncbi:hypothetical protein [Actinomadura rugatobispora]|uniref:Uncharacterized protein n=1 Tax=Actinomadura rugatobispora TaxID=1994 RepID=A0ABW1AJK9_9ACTN|nr:hypothetical protein GCM10010200_033160 [Actinomadura rugatobispora]